MDSNGTADPLAVEGPMSGTCDSTHHKMSLKTTFKFLVFRNLRQKQYFVWQLLQILCLFSYSDVLQQVTVALTSDCH